MDLDNTDAFVSAPDYKYCQACVKSGHKNTKEERERNKKISKLEEIIYNSNLKEKYPNEDEIWILDKGIKMIDENIKFNKIMKIQSVYNSAKEIFGTISKINLLKETVVESGRRKPEKLILMKNNLFTFLPENYK